MTGDQDLIDRPAPHDQRVETLVAAFRREFGHDPEGIAEVPGRVNLIGEHVDYNDGLVLPVAIDRSVMVAWGQRDALRSVFIHSVDFDETCACDVLTVEAAEYGNVFDEAWLHYPEGVLWALVEKGILPEELPAANLGISGDVPLGGGLSSSAAVEVATAGALRDVFGVDIDDVTLAKLCQRAENEFVGVQCGIMDQFASTLSRADHALLIDCRSLDYEHIPLRLDAAGLAIVVANSAVTRDLATAAYNDRRRECEQAVALLRKLLHRPKLVSLRDIDPSHLDHAKLRLSAQSERGPGGEALRRARHVVTEIARVRRAADALRRDDFAALGALMAESHRSLRDDFEVSSPELDLLVELATAQPYVLGARLTGAGFGGCTVNLAQADAVDDFARDVIAPYRERTGRLGVMYVVRPSDGLRTWRL
jgi:galactokinase